MGASSEDTALIHQRGSPRNAPCKWDREQASAASVTAYKKIRP
jgi:hypothetical protein